MSRVKTWKEIIESKIDKTQSCWIWTSMIGMDGYGKIGRRIPGTRKKTWHRAHRIAYEVYKGPIPAGMLICHTCDNPLCCNPDHLFTGTPLDNSQDMIKKGRKVNPLNKLNFSDVLDLRRMFESGEYTNARLSRRFNISETQCREICKSNRRKTS